ncbi:hypothetical protein F511_35995 [Dorcoceras hygrometricum]|uniref:Acyl-CoA dehydrogenase-related protein n=1 Tax=Dorcoceras hygrometricum TaxID=472368 RepID=A0A2Z7D3G9_9LAMI|nr:hypothetical protein F511_35995 [Dorcoceras hygrometricum]
MSLFDLQDVCIAIGSIATLDLPMVVDLIGIYGLKGPYCTLTTTNWFLQALSVIPRGSWGDVARRFTMPPPLLSTNVAAAAAAAARLRRKIVSGQFDEENPFVLISSVLLVQADEEVSFLVVDRIGDIYRNLPRRADVIVTTVGARHKCQQGSGFEHPMYVDNCYCCFVLIVSRLYILWVVDRIGDIYRNLPRRADVIVTTVGARHKCQQDRDENGIKIPAGIRRRPTTRMNARYMRAGRAWMGAASRYRREMSARCATKHALVLRRRATRGACWPDEATLAGRVARPHGRCWSRRCTPLDARCRAPACSLEAHVILVDGGAAGRPAAPASLRRRLV